MKKIFIFLISFFIALFLLQTYLTLFAQEKKLNSPLVISPYFKIESETEILGPLNLKNSLNLLSINGLKGEINISNLKENRTYTLPDLSGEICLSAGNCLFLPQGIQNRLAKFSAQGLGNSSIEDFAKNVAISIDSNGNVGIGKNPINKLDVAGKIQAEDDICTVLGTGICLSQLSQLKEQITEIKEPLSLKEATVKGGGTPEKIPIWKEDYKLGDSEIFQLNNNIGIGMEPSYKLDVAGTVRMLGFRLPVSPKEGYGLLSDDNGFGTWRPVLTPEEAGMDVAENFLLNPKCEELNNCPEAGDLVSINEEGFIEKSKIPYDKKLIGVVSTKPTLTLGKEISHLKHQPVALIGRVPAKVSLKNGSIEIGDFLTSSEIEGVAQKATQKGRVIGVALQSLTEEDFKNCTSEKIINCENKIGKIEVLINLSQI